MHSSKTMYQSRVFFLGMPNCVSPCVVWGSDLGQKGVGAVTSVSVLHRVVGLASCSTESVAV